MRRLTIAILFIIIATATRAQEFSGTATGEAMAGAASTLCGIDAVHYNVAGTAYSSTGVMASYHNRYFLKELSQKNLGLALPALKGVFSLAVNNFGYHLYNQTKADLGYAMKLGKNVSAGVKINWHNLHISESEERNNAFSGEVGVIYSPIDNLKIGASAANVSNSQFNNNHDDFDCKMNRVIKEISNVLGLPQPIVEERKYIVEKTGELPEDSIQSEITQTYLQGEPEAEIRLRKRCWGQKQVFVHTTKKKTSENEELVTERQINNSLYEMMLGLADPTRHTVHKIRNSFIWKGQYFEVDTYQDQLQGLVILETKGIAEGEPVKFPPFLKVVKEVTGNEDYYNYNLAKKKEQ